MSVFSKLQPVFIILSAFAGVLAGKIDANAAGNAAGLIEIFLMSMLFFTFLGVDIKEISKSFMDLRFSVSALAINFLWTPVFAFLAGKIFLSGQAGLQIGFIMLMVTPCTDWYLVFTGLANGNVTLGASVLPLNLILQIVLMPVYLLVFMGQAVAFDIMAITRSIILVLAVPLVSAPVVKVAAKKTGKMNFFRKVLKEADNIQFILLCCAIVAMFASQGAALTANMAVFVRLLPPLIVFFVTNFFLSFGAGRALKMAFMDIIPLVFTTSARNSPVSLAIAVMAFPAEPLIYLALVAGPLIELPVLALYSVILKKMHSGSVSA
ncbi:MAG: arsenic resistance protein [Spirochaetaceae bacterium]|jgi:ACR3 family arsenite efflux pump ArsB|nr:arsenic resistance protein [Spirochaetaceae bacterium]